MASALPQVDQKQNEQPKEETKTGGKFLEAITHDSDKICLFIRIQLNCVSEKGSQWIFLVEVRLSVIFYPHHHQHFYLSLFIIKIPVWLGPNRYMYSQSYLFLAGGEFQDIGKKYRAAAL